MPVASLGMWLLAAALAGCGQKGSLRLPEAASAAAASAASTPTSAPDATASSPR